MKRKHIALIVVGLVVLDQIVKIIIKTNMTLGESIHVFGDWFQLYFIENEGAAYGMSLGGEYGKLALSLFRIVAVCAGGWFVNYLWKKKVSTGLLVAVAFIMAGAIGNIVDSAFYGLVFSESTYASVATFMPEGGGYAGFLHGKVVDMLHFPLFTLHDLPSWMDWLTGGDGDFTFFAPVFNVADSYITSAIIYMILFQYKYFK
ncbi:MAG: lipoprotein signal peptidase [Alistipes sp.]|jgi:signal peptidase II|nr:lipoprotein signal peptidase [Alistipes sp.]